MTKIFIASDKDKGKRIDIFLTEQLGDLSRSQIQKLCDEGKVSVAGTSTAKNYRLALGDTVEVSFATDDSFRIIPENIPLSIFYEDDDIIIVDKPQGMVVHPTPNDTSGTLVNALAYRYPNSLSDIGGKERPGIVHRLDKDTSGLLIVAKNNAAHRALAKQVQSYSIDRKYKALVYGELTENPQGSIDAYIMRDPVVRTKMTATVVPEALARSAKTYYEVLEYYHGYTLLELTLETGRTHQIRVHLEHLGFPVVGDPVYGNRPTVPGLKGQLLHSYALEFTHPSTGESMQFESPLPHYFTDFIAIISSDSY